MLSAWSQNSKSDCVSFVCSLGRVLSEEKKRRQFLIEETMRRPLKPPEGDVIRYATSTPSVLLRVTAQRNHHPRLASAIRLIPEHTP